MGDHILLTEWARGKTDSSDATFFTTDFYFDFFFFCGLNISRSDRVRTQSTGSAVRENRHDLRQFPSSRGQINLAGGKQGGQYQRQKSVISG